ncbi:Ulp1 protease family protein [Cordyceps militaris CM01]|uniref:Ulp1 protease family protein n=1 Tax=Cordyceps militaris (strain CM01) TaxID=983644 RepID=G3JPT3_CORMM|nr:Ulp1 protease family protein [Cordyceps militaris CM01]EGX89184.1 Ulp1 protease family protein [Cordyceps militaris CM01]
MIGNLRSALSSVGSAVKIFYHDHATTQAREKTPRAKRLKLSAVPVKSYGDRNEEVKTEPFDQVSDSNPGGFGKSCADGASQGNHALLSPPPSPKKPDLSQPHRKARWFLKFRARSDQNESASNTDDEFDGARTGLSTRDIFKRRRRDASRQTPKRPGRSPLPKPVKFADNTGRPVRPRQRHPVADELPDLKKLTLEAEPTISTAGDKRFAERFLAPVEIFDYVPRYSNTHEDFSVNHDDRINAILDEKQPWSLELNSAVVESIQAQRKTQVSDEDITREYITNLQDYEVRSPCRPLLLSLSSEMSKRTISTIRASPDAVLAKAADSTPLHRHDFCRVIPKTEWLNDEVVNGVLSWLDQAVNHIGGVNDPRTQTRKCLVMTSFYYKQIKTACKNTQRTLRRKGITKDNLLKVNTILLPICEHSHWTLMVINPSKRTVAHIDSLNPRGNKPVTELALLWMKDALDEKFVPAEWSTIKYCHPAQTNGYDCGVHTICNAICVAVGVDPSEAYKAVDMPALRLQMSAVLVNGGFTGELDLLGF